MGLVSLGGGNIIWPALWGSNKGWGDQTNPPGTGNLTTLTASGYQNYAIIQISVGGNIGTIGFRTNTVSGTTPQIQVSIQTLNASIQPSGSMYGGSAASASTTVSSNTTYELTLGTPATATAGDYVAIVIQCSGGTTPSIIIANDFRVNTNFPFTGFYNNSTYTVSANNMCFILGYSSITSTGASGYVPGGMSSAIETYSSTAFNSGSATSRRALKIIAPCDMTAIGCYVWGTWAAGAILGMNFYDANNNKLVATATNSDVQGWTTNGARAIFFSTSANLTNGNAYRLSLEPQNTNNFTEYEFTFTSGYAYPNPINNLPGGVNAYLSTYTSGSWTDNINKRPTIALIISAVSQYANQGFIGLNWP